MKKFLEIYSFESEIERKQRLVLRFLFTELCAVVFEDDGDSLRQWLGQLLRTRETFTKTALSDTFHSVQMISMFSEKEDLFLEWNYNAKVISMGGQRSPRVLIVKKVRLICMMVHYRVSYIRYLPDVSPMTRCDWLRGMPPGLALCMLTLVTYLVPRYTFQ